METKTNRLLIICIVIMLIVLSVYYIFVKQSPANTGPQFTPLITTGALTTQTPTSSPIVSATPSPSVSPAPTPTPTTSPTLPPTPTQSPPPTPTISPTLPPTPTPTPTAPPETGLVRISDFSYSPSDLLVTKGTIIVFSNIGAVNHTATGDGGEFNTGTIQPGKSVSLDTSAWSLGNHPYHCLFHGAMNGRIIVQ